MDSSGLVQARGAQWKALETLLASIEAGGVRALTLAQTQELLRLYRGTSGDLLLARARGAPAELTAYLNDLVGRAYAVTAPRRRFRWAAIREFLAHDFPDTVRREVWMILAAGLFVFAGAGFGWIGMALDPTAAPYLVPAQHLELDPVQRAERERTEGIAGVGEQAEFSSFLFTHNIQVGFLAFALGMTAGIGTGVVLFANGVMLGSLAQVYAARGLSGWFWAWILPHGIPELTAIFLAGAAGLVLARGLVAPRGLPRAVSLRKEARVALRLVLGTVPILVLAGIIEGTISQIHPPQLPVAIKVGFALVVGAAVYAWLGSSWLREARARRAGGPVLRRS